MLPHLVLTAAYLKDEVARQANLRPADDADLLDGAISSVLAGGLRTGDIMQEGMAKVSTSVMGETIIRELDKAAST